ncbi:hypothetical protein Sango_0837800 [Sesamum angolense]|uniref:CCHC-type domain-containing protein n=1 Tax=Sesamum angolense TaxID=2727404 RepID=A0AAE1X3I8_9LAMI|nr:hypothetical protein Sango_0837800 [Sesamum angolense]
MEAKVRRPEELIGKPEQPPSVGLIQQVSSVQEMVESLKMKVNEELPETVLKGLEYVSDEISCLTDVVDYKLESLKVDLRLVKLAVANSGTDGSAVAPKVRVPDPKPFGGERSAKELENFLWDMETYFQAARVPDTEKVSITSMYLTGDAKLWWRSRLSDDASANRERIETWEVLKKELKDQFLPCNTSWLAGKSLRNLKHTGMVREFVKEFSSLMLDTELRRQGVKDLPTAIAAADRLGDYKVPNEPEQRIDDSGDGNAKFGKKFKKKDKVKKVMMETSEPRSVERPRAGCFICGNLEHRARDCPKRGRLNAIVAKHTDSEQETGPARVGAMQLGTLQVQSRGCGEAQSKGLVMVPGRIHGKEMKALVDTGATHNFVSDRVVQKLGLDVRTWDSRVKAVNSKAVPVSGVANVELCVGSWSGQCKFVAAGLDDFDVILGIDFFVNANVIILPRMCGIFISGGDKPSSVKGEYDGVTTAGKKSGVAEARSSNASSSKEGAQSPRLAGFSCIGTMQEEMHRRWTKAQQICGAEPETFMCEEMLKCEQECEVGHSDDVREGKRASVQSTSGAKESTTTASTRTSTSFGGVVCKTLEVQCGRHAHWTRQPVTTDVGTGVCGVGRRSVDLCCAARGHAGLASVVSVGRRAGAWASRRPCAETFGRLCARARADADGSRQAGRR